MPELAEVEFHRRQWDPGMGHRVESVALHDRTRLFRGIDPPLLRRRLTGAKLVSSEARGKQMIFRFSTDAWLGVHLGMTGALRSEVNFAESGRHDHLVLHQTKQSLVFNDPRQFGRVRFDVGADEPEWWNALPPPLTSRSFTLARLSEFLRRHRRAPMKAVLLRQEFFSGVGNWMADEILWRAVIHPARPAGDLNDSETRVLHRVIQFVCRGALRIVAKDYSDPPASWLFRHRWRDGGHCPKDGSQLERATIGGRTTAWCARCQPKR
jgi:formamidopyrimidine-DNA glycosylase